MSGMRSHTLRGCVDWNRRSNSCIPYVSVTPCVGVWIETFGDRNRRRVIDSHTLRGCVDWNWHHIYPLSPVLVTPCVGVWIETYMYIQLCLWLWVTPCVGVWIETFCLRSDCDTHAVTPCVGVWIETTWSLLVRAHLLSHPAWVCGLKHQGNLYLRHNPCVTPCVGVWIETYHYTWMGKWWFVTPCVGVWIETL